jgi:hypothetical protein
MWASGLAAVGGGTGCVSAHAPCHERRRRVPSRARSCTVRPPAAFADGWTRHAVPSVEPRTASDDARELWAILAVPLLIQVPGFALLWALLP